MTSRQTWMITGAGRGLGRALTLAALDAGHRVLATVRADHALPERDGLVVHRLDVTDRAGAREAVGRAVAELGSLDVLVNNAGFGLVGAVEEVDEESARAIIDTNLLGALWVTQAALPVMRARGSGDIVQVSTVGAVGTMPMMGLYNASKWGLEAFSEALADEVRAWGIRVTLAELGGLDTQWATSSMRFAGPDPDYDRLRATLFGTSDVPWSGEGTGGGTAPSEAAEAILRHVADRDDDRLRLLVGDEAPAQVVAALDRRRRDYERDPRFVAASDQALG